MKENKVVDIEALKAKRIEDRAIRKLRNLLIRIWLIKNWFTIVIIITVILLSLTVTGLMPEHLPIIGTYSYALKDALKEFLQIGDSEFYSLFGSIAGIFSLLFSIGYASSKIKAVSYYMIDNDKIRKVLLKVNLSMTDKGKIISIENRIGIDINGNGFIGTTPVEPEEESSNVFLVTDVINTVSEFNKIINIKKDILRDAIKENEIAIDTTNSNAESTPTTNVAPVAEPTPEVVAKRPSTPFRPNKF